MKALALGSAFLSLDIAPDHIFGNVTDRRVVCPATPKTRTPEFLGFECRKLFEDSGRGNGFECATDFNRSGAVISLDKKMHMIGHDFDLLKRPSALFARFVKHALQFVRDDSTQNAVAILRTPNDVVSERENSVATSCRLHCACTFRVLGDRRGWKDIFRAASGESSSLYQFAAPSPVSPALGAALERPQSSIAYWLGCAASDLREHLIARADETCDCFVNTVLHLLACKVE